MPTLPNPTSIVYNGVTFPTESETSFNLTFVPDVSRRTIAQTTVSMTVKANILAGAGQDASLDAIRAALERPGGQLVVTGLGFGTLAINTAAGKKDLAFGPMPKTLAWKNTGAGRAAQVVWQCEVAVIGCLGAADSGQVMELGWTATFALDNGGFLTRTIAGEYRLPMTRAAVGSPALPDCADNYFERFVPVAGDGFARTITHTVDRSKASVEFTVVDQELAGYPLPPGVVSATGSHTYSCDKAATLVKWTSNLTAAFEMARDWPRGKAWDYFKALAADRFDRLRRIGWRFFPLSLSIGEPELYGRQGAAFTLVCSMYRTRPAVGVERAAPFAGLWVIPPGASWSAHTNSLADGARSPRGFAQGRVNAGDDTITDLCLSVGAVSGSLATVPPEQDRQATDDEWDQFKQSIGAEDNPDPASTWLRYRCVPRVEEHNRLHAHFPLPVGPDPNAGNNTLRTPGFNGSPGDFPHTADTFALESQDSPPPVVQYGGSAGYYVWLVGEALRHTYEIPRPVPPTVGGQVPIPANDPRLGTYWTSGVVGQTVARIFAARWCLRYFVPRTYGQQSTLAPVMPHPWQQGPTPVR